MRRTHRLCFPSLIWNAVAEVRVVLRLPISVGLLRLAHPRTVRRVLARNRPLRTQTAKRVQCAFCKMEFCSFYLSPSSADDKCKAPAAKTPRLRHRALRTGRRSGRSSAARNVEAAQARRSRLWLFARSANAASRLFVPVAGDGTDERAQGFPPLAAGRQRPDVHSVPCNAKGIRRSVLFQPLDQQQRLYEQNVRRAADM